MLCTFLVGMLVGWAYTMIGYVSVLLRKNIMTTPLIVATDSGSGEIKL